jgi:hypothetical protein
MMAPAKQKKIALSRKRAVERATAEALAASEVRAAKKLKSTEQTLDPGTAFLTNLRHNSEAVGAAARRKPTPSLPDETRSSFTARPVFSGAAVMERLLVSAKPPVQTIAAPKMMPNVSDIESVGNASRGLSTLSESTTDFMITDHIKKKLFRTSKFLSDANLCFSNDSESICQKLAKTCGIQAYRLEEWWESKRRLVLFVFNNHRNNVIKSIKKAFFCKWRIQCTIEEMAHNVGN